ncbi:MAG TPA: glycosyltransferase [Solirubrobacteraceae bacterium]|jgi:tetratricopeptide (TPR) repeat protein
MPSLALCMIVRNEADSVERCLAACSPHIDYWVICDTGSTDGTPELIQQVLGDIPGELHHHEWRDFGHNRSRLMELAHRKADYLLLLDADWRLEATPQAFDGLRADSYMVVHAGNVEFHNKRVVSGRIPWRYVGATHEYITSPDERSCERLADVVIHVESVGGGRTGRWHRDRELLEAALAEDPTDARSAYYLAQTLRDLGRDADDPGLLGEALKAYEQRAQMDGWDEETYCALHQAGALAAELGDWPGAADHLAAAWELRPSRLEAVHDLAQGLRLNGRYRAAHRFSSLAMDMQPLPVPADNLLVAPWIYRWGLLFEYSITAYWVGEHANCVRACDALLGMPELPIEHRRQTERNRTLGIQAQARRMAANVVSTTALH